MDILNKIKVWGKSPESNKHLAYAFLFVSVLSLISGNFYLALMQFLLAASDFEIYTLKKANQLRGDK